MLVGSHRPLGPCLEGPLSPGSAAWAPFVFSGHLPRKDYKSVQTGCVQAGSGLLKAGAVSWVTSETWLGPTVLGSNGLLLCRCSFLLVEPGLAVALAKDPLRLPASREVPGS